MIRAWSLIRLIMAPRMYLWIDAILVHETPKATLIVFDGRKAWIPKTWLCRIKRKKGLYVIASPAKRGGAISIKISEFSPRDIPALIKLSHSAL